MFGTRLTRVTRELDGRDPDRALAARRRKPSATGRAARASAPRWPSSTACHGRRIGRGALVVVLSDGWDRGDPEELAEEMARLRRCVAPRRVAEPARGRPPLRAADARDARGAAARRPAAAGQLDRLAGGAGRADPGGGIAIEPGSAASCSPPARAGASAAPSSWPSSTAGRCSSTPCDAMRRRPQLEPGGRRARRTTPSAIRVGGPTCAGPSSSSAPDWADGQSASLRGGRAPRSASVEAAVVHARRQPVRAPPQAIAGMRRARGGPRAVRADLRRRPGHPVLLERPLLDRARRAERRHRRPRPARGERVRSFEAGRLGRPDRHRHARRNWRSSR